MALLCHSCNMTVISCCHNADSKGAKYLQGLQSSKRMYTLEVDLLKHDTLVEARGFLEKFLKENKDHKLLALVNNAGIMCFGEFEWQTRNLFEQQINVNLLGPMRLTKELLPIIRSHKSRIINVTSHCGLQSLPGIAAYGASKAGLRFWNDALRIELAKFGVKVVNFIPGSFVMSSNIASRQQDHANEMETQFSKEQQHFYGDYFKEYNEYLKIISGPKPLQFVDEHGILNTFKRALLDENPKSIYINEPLRYKIYRILFNICPTYIVDWLTIKFVSMPDYKYIKVLKK
ncbi:hypothetical protein ACFFRR_007218 [Megaselia abdita]